MKREKILAITNLYNIICKKNHFIDYRRDFDEEVLHCASVIQEATIGRYDKKNPEPYKGLNGFPSIMYSGLIGGDGKTIRPATFNKPYLSL